MIEKMTATIAFDHCCNKEPSPPRLGNTVDGYPPKGGARIAWKINDAG
jgi:hypothetical protein